MDQNCRQRAKDLWSPCAQITPQQFEPVLGRSQSQNGVADTISHTKAPSGRTIFVRQKTIPIWRMVTTIERLGCIGRPQMTWLIGRSSVSHSEAHPISEQTLVSDCWFKKPISYTPIVGWFPPLSLVHPPPVPLILWVKSLFLTIKSWEFHISAASSFNSTQVTHPNNVLRMKSIEIPPDPSEMVGFLFYPTDPYAKIIPRYHVAAAPPAPFAPRSVPPAPPAPPSVPSPRGGRGCAAAAGARRRAPQPVWRQRWGPRQAGKGSPRVTIMWIFLAVFGPKMSWADTSDGAFMCFCWSWILMCETGIEYILLQELSET